MARDANDIPLSTLTLILTPGIGPATLRALRRSIGSDEAILGAPARRLRAVDGIGPVTAGALRRSVDRIDAERERERIRDHDARLILLGDDDYPPLLAAIDDPPPALWIRGRLPDPDRQTLAIVGSRRCTTYGREQAARLAALLAGGGMAIVSGGARGIDAAAHHGVLRLEGHENGGMTVAVLGCGLARCYPPEHAPLFERIVASGGAVVSEHPMAAAPRASNFPRRNRIISGLSVGVLVIEAGLRSGALITARLAADDHGREVMALPGRVDSATSLGCLRAVREGWAALVTDHREVLEQLGSSPLLLRGAREAASEHGRPPVVAPAPPVASLQNELQERIVDALIEAGGAGLALDELAVRIDQPMHRLMAEMTVLEIAGHVTRGEGRIAASRRAG